MKTKQKQSSPLNLYIDSHNAYPALMVETESSLLEVKNLHPDHTMPDIFVGMMILLRTQVGDLHANYMAYKSGVWFFKFVRTKTTISMEILEQILKPYDKYHKIVSQEVCFKWKGKFELFDSAVKGLLKFYPDYKVCDLIAPKSIV